MELLNKTQTKQYIKKNNLKIGRDAIPTIEQKLQELIQQSITRAKRNQRKTLLGRDL